MLSLLTRTPIPGGGPAACHTDRSDPIPRPTPLHGTAPLPRTPFILGILLGGLLPLLAAGRAGAAGTPEAVQWVDRLQERLTQCHDYQYLVSSFERKGEQKESRCYRLFAKDSRLVRIKVVDGRGKGSEATLDPKGRVRGRKGGLLKPFAQTLDPDDRRLRSLRGTPFWDCACHNFLKELRARILLPGTHCEVEPDREQPGQLLLTVERPGATREKYWIDTHQMHIVKGETFEGDLLVQEFSIRELKENVGLDDDFFSF
jgi:outer membrane lipoprotein-sorting protein